MPATLPTPIVNSLAGRDWNRPSAKDWATVLAALPLFAQISKRQLRKIAELARITDYATNAVVMHEGDPGDSLHIVLSGRARVLGKPRARILKTGDYFGEMALIDGAPRSATIAAEGELQTMRISRKQFMRLVEREPSIGVAMLEELAGRVRRLEKDAD
jgi:CRP/FNR family transcriptional regulator, cyclic AMP receptor protein